MTIVINCHWPFFSWSVVPEPLAGPHSFETSWGRLQVRPSSSETTKGSPMLQSPRQLELCLAASIALSVESDRSGATDKVATCSVTDNSDIDHDDIRPGLADSRHRQSASNGQALHRRIADTPPGLGENTVFERIARSRRNNTHVSLMINSLCHCLGSRPVDVRYR
jgi:hypothetical protein